MDVWEEILEVLRARPATTEALENQFGRRLVESTLLSLMGRWVLMGCREPHEWRLGDVSDKEPEEDSRIRTAFERRLVEVVAASPSEVEAAAFRAKTDSMTPAELDAYLRELHPRHALTTENPSLLRGHGDWGTPAESEALSTDGVVAALGSGWFREVLGRRAAVYEEGGEWRLTDAARLVVERGRVHGFLWSLRHRPVTFSEVVEAMGDRDAKWVHNLLDDVLREGGVSVTSSGLYQWVAPTTES